MDAGFPIYHDYNLKTWIHKVQGGMKASRAAYLHVLASYLLNKNFLLGPKIEMFLEIMALQPICSSRSLN